MKMNLKPNIRGFMFYNEVLFGFYSNYYTKDKQYLKGMNKVAA